MHIVTFKKETAKYYARFVLGQSVRRRDWATLRRFLSVLVLTCSELFLFSSQHLLQDQGFLHNSLSSSLVLILQNPCSVTGPHAVFSIFPDTVHNP
jgi:hypothetical protein